MQLAHLSYSKDINDQLPHLSGCGLKLLIINSFKILKISFYQFEYFSGF